MVLLANEDYGITSGRQQPRIGVRARSPRSLQNKCLNKNVKSKENELTKFKSINYNRKNKI